MPVKIGTVTAYTVDELAEKFASTVIAFRRYIRAGKLKANKVGGRWYVTETALRDFLETPQAEELATIEAEEDHAGAETKA